MTQPKIEDVGHGKPVMPFGSDGTNWYAILVDALGHLQVDVVSAALGTGGATETTLLLIKGYVDTLETLLAGGLPAALDSGALKVKEQSPLTGFATSANQTTMITALQLIDDLRNALGSVNTDDLQVDVKTYPGSNVLGNFPFGYNDKYWEASFDLSVPAGTVIKTLTPVPAGEVWILTLANCENATTARNMAIDVGDGTNWITLADALGSGTRKGIQWSGNAIMKEGDRVRFVFFSTVLNEDLYWKAMGYKMKIA